jgi:type II secretory pathway pseudopilin PulG
MKKLSNGFGLVGILVLLAIIGAGSYVVANKYVKTGEVSESNSAIDQARHAADLLEQRNQGMMEDGVGADPVAEWKTYQNEKLGLEIRYPQTFEVIPGMTKLVAVKPNSSDVSKIDIGSEVNGQFQEEYSVQVFNKSISQTLEEAITSTFLNQPTFKTNCEVVLKSINWSGFQVKANISPKVVHTTEDFSKCPSLYTVVGAGSKSGFVYNPAYPDRYAFYTTGEQEPPFGSANGLWWPSESLRFYK